MKLLNIEIPSYNSEDDLFKHFLPSLNNLLPLKDIADITINLNGENAEEDKKRAEAILSQSGFDYYLAVNKYTSEYNSILRIREDTHSISPNKYKYSLLIDDDFVVSSEDYSRYVLAAIQSMELNPKIGVVGMKRYEKEKYHKDIVFPAPPRYVFSIHGGMILHNVPKWGGLVKKELRDLYSSIEDILFVYERLMIGLQTRFMHNNAYQHIELKSEQNDSGLVSHGWGESFYKEGSIWSYLKSKGIGRDCVIPNAMWTGEAYWEDKTNEFDFSEYSLNDLLTTVKDGVKNDK